MDNSTTATPVPGLETNTEQNVIVSTLELRTLNPETFLYTELIKAHLGERAAAIVRLLICKGRLAARDLCEKIDLDLKSVKTTLVSLIQLKCVQYLEETSLTGKKTTYYYVHEEGILLLLYAGEIVYFIQSYFEKSDATGIAAQIVQNVLALGSLTPRDYLQFAPAELSPSEISSTFVKLCELGFLVPISPIDYTPINDLWNKLYKKEYANIPKTSTLSDLKKRTEAKQKAKIEFNNLLKASDLSKIFVTDPQTSLRKVSDNVPLTFNLKRYLKSKRSKQLAQFASVRVGRTPAAIYQVALKLTEQRSPDLVDPLTKTGLLQDLDERNAIQDELTLQEEKAPGVTFNAIDIARHLPDTVDLRGSLTSKQKTTKRAKTASGSHQQSKRIKTEDGFVIPSLPSTVTTGLPQEAEAEEEEEEEEEDIDLDLDEDDSDPHSITLVNGHLRLLSGSQVPFLKESKPGLYYVPYSKLVPALKLAVYDSLIASTLGASASRILRCVRANSLVTEKVINSTALMKEKDIRSVISVLIKYNAVEIQEVPRTADRAASRAVFLFRNNEKHAYDFMKQNLAWNIANLLHKVEGLKDENATLLTKASRDDVKGRELELLLPSEINQLKMVNERELNGLSRRTRLLALWEVFKLF